MTEPDPIRARLSLRGRLLALRRGALAQLAKSDRIDNGLLRLVADTGAVLAQLDAEIDTIAEAGDRAVVTDDGERIALTVYSARSAAAAATLSPAGAIHLAGCLIAAALPRLR